MPASVALDAAGKPTVALQRKLDALGRGHLGAPRTERRRRPRPPDDRVRRQGRCVFLRSIAKGSPLQLGLQEALDDTLAQLPIPKVMSYAARGGYYNDVKFVRPAHRLVALHGDDVVAVTALGLVADRVTGGHRFLSRADIRIATADAYEETLRAEGKVIASFAERRSAIVDALAKAAAGCDRHHAGRAARRSDRAGRMARRPTRAGSIRGS